MCAEHLNFNKLSLQAPVERAIIEEETLLELTEDSFATTLSHYPACIIEYYLEDSESYQLTSG